LKGAESASPTEERRAKPPCDNSDDTHPVVLLSTRSASLDDDKLMTDFITTVKNSRPSTHWKDFTKSKEVAVLKKAILVFQKKINPGNISKFARQFFERMAKRPNLYEMSHLI
jgi:hypothetical protein